MLLLNIIVMTSDDVVWAMYILHLNLSCNLIQHLSNVYDIFLNEGHWAGLYDSKKI